MRSILGLLFLSLATGASFPNARADVPSAEPPTCPAEYFMFLGEYRYSQEFVLRKQKESNAVFNFFSGGLQSHLSYEPDFAGWVIRLEKGTNVGAGKDSEGRRYCEYREASEKRKSDLTFRLTELAPNYAKLDIYTWSPSREEMSFTMYLRTNSELSRIDQLTESGAQELAKQVNHPVPTEGRLNLNEKNGDQSILATVSNQTFGSARN